MTPEAQAAMPILISPVPDRHGRHARWRRWVSTPSAVALSLEAFGLLPESLANASATLRPSSSAGAGRSARSFEGDGT